MASACNKESDIDSIKPQEIITPNKIEEAKQWFENSHLAKRSSNTTKAKNLDWNKAVAENRENGTRVYVPFSYSGNSFLAKNERYRLLINIDKNGNKKASIIHYIANSDYYSKRNSISIRDFTGLILVSDWDDNFLYGFKYQDAKIIGDVSRESSKADGLGNKPNGMECTFMTVIYYSQACSAGTCWDMVEVYRETYSVCISTGGGGSAGGGGEGGGPLGGGGGSTPGGSGDPAGCGDAIICPDGTTNPILEKNLVRIINESDYVTAEVTQTTPTLGNYGATLRVMDGFAQVVEATVEINTSTKDLKKIAVTIGGVVWMTALTQNGEGTLTRYDSSSDTYYFHVSITKTYGDTFANTRTLYGQISPSHGTGKIYFP